jgi:hypothetical protein
MVKRRKKSITKKGTGKGFNEMPSVLQRRSQQHHKANQSQCPRRLGEVCL